MPAGIGVKMKAKLDLMNPIIDVLREEKKTTFLKTMEAMDVEYFKKYDAYYKRIPELSKPIDYKAYGTRMDNIKEDR
jgi:hypothetical protein